MANNNEEANGEASHRPPPFPKQNQVNQLQVPQLNMPLHFRGQVRQFSPNSGIENGSKRPGIPPYHPQLPSVLPYSQIPFNRPALANHLVGQQNFSSPSHVPSHTRSLSQPTMFSMDSLPPLSPSPHKPDQFDVFMDERDGSSRPFLPTTPFTRGNSSRIGESLPPRKAHRRSNSDIPFGFSSVIHSSLSVMPLRSPGALDRSMSARETSAKPAQLILKGAESNGEGTGKRKTEVDICDDLVSTYMNLDDIDVFNSSDEKLGIENKEDSKASGSKTNGNGCDSSDNEATSGSVNEIGSVQKHGVYLSAAKKEGLKRNAFGNIASTSRHHRSVSMDSFMGKINYAEEFPSALPSPGATPGQLSPASSIDANSDAFSLEFGNGEFSSADLQKIMSNEKLSEIAITDPKRARRILANRQSAARSKERRMKYIAELEHKVVTLQTEATTMSAQVTMLQRDSAGLSAHNQELRIRLQSMEQQALLRDALNETLIAEVQRLRHSNAELDGDFQQLSINSQSFQLANGNMQHSQPQQSNGNTTANQ